MYLRRTHGRLKLPDVKRFPYVMLYGYCEMRPTPVPLLAAPMQRG
jgi:hypothetical protein